MALPDKVHEPVCSRSTWGSLIAGRLTCWLQPGRRRTHASIEPLPAGGALHQPGRGWLWWRHMAAIWLCELRRSASRMSLRRRHQHVMGCQPVADQAGDQEGSRAKGRVGSKPPTAETAGICPHLNCASSMCPCRSIASPITAACKQGAKQRRVWQAMWQPSSNNAP